MDDEDGYFVPQDAPHLAPSVTDSKAIWHNMIATVQVAMVAVRAAGSPDEYRVTIGEAREALRAAEGAHGVYMDALRKTAEFQERDRGLDLSKHKDRIEARRLKVRRSTDVVRAKLDAIEAVASQN